MANDRPPLERKRNINGFYKKVVGDKSKINAPSTSNLNILIQDQRRPCKSQRVGPLICLPFFASLVCHENFGLYSLIYISININQSLRF